jgi:hypothetical protein
MNSWQQPDNSSPSVGTLHLLAERVLIVNNVSPASTAEQTVDLSSYIPVGTKAVMVCEFARASTAGYNVLYRYPSGTTWLTFPVVTTTAAILHGGGTQIVPIGSNRSFIWACNNAVVSNVTIYLQGYYL